MERPPRTSGWSGALLIALAYILRLALLYALSFEPSIYLCHAAGDLPGCGRAFCVFYSPLAWAYENTPAHEPLGWYVGLWFAR